MLDLDWGATKMSNPNEPAYPVMYETTAPFDKGITIRQKAALMMAAAHVACKGVPGDPDSFGHAMCYIADAVLRAERESRSDD